jgi:hypothetical protein
VKIATVALEDRMLGEIRTVRAIAEDAASRADSLGRLVTPDAEKQAYVIPASNRISEFLDPVLANTVAGIIWDVSIVFAPKTDLSVYEFAMYMEAIGEHESKFKRDAVSKAGVPGPWQCSYTLAKALAENPVIRRYVIKSRRDLMDYEVSAWYGAAAFVLFLEAYDQNISIALVAWHDGETLVNKGRITPAAKYLRSNVLAILKRNTEEGAES